MSWTHPFCELCWRETNPDREPVRITEDHREAETCCRCGEFTRSGIYVRADPRTLAYHGGHA